MGIANKYVGEELSMLGAFVFFGLWLKGCLKSPSTFSSVSCGEGGILILFHFFLKVNMDAFYKHEPKSAFRRTVGPILEPSSTFHIALIHAQLPKSMRFLPREELSKLQRKTSGFALVAEGEACCLCSNETSTSALQLHGLCWDFFPL